jgi:hypothetical protein
VPVHLARAPQTDDELDLVIQALWGVKLPRVRVCEGHSAPFEAVAHAYFARNPGFAVWYASRGSGKSLALAVLGLTKTFVADADCTILGGSIWQSQNVREHMSKMLAFPNAPLYAVAKDIQTVIETTTKKKITPLPASQTSVRGPHPPLQLLDEVDEMEEKIYHASLGQAMEQLNSRGEVLGEYIVASSTWQNPIGTFTNVIEDARRKGHPVFTWCWRELLQPNGWMSQKFIDRKRGQVSAEMWRTEYELNEPSGSSRAFDLDAIEKYFVDYETPIHEEHAVGDTDDFWVWERPKKGALYAAGADWAKEVDKTVLAVVRYDVEPRRLVALRRMNRTRYPVMTGAFEDLVVEYNAVAQHDKTGVGNAINDFLSDEAAQGFVMVGRARSQMFTDYIADFEQGGYRLPKNVEAFYKNHRGTTTADVFAPHKWDGHTPDDVVAMALAHRAAGRIAAPVPITEIKKDPTPRDVDKPFYAKPELTRVEGLVQMVDERFGLGDDQFSGDDWFNRMMI